MTRPVTDATRTGIRAVLADRGPRRQRLPGFDADYFDIVHYILRCTYRIWEERGLDLIATHYAPRARVVTTGGIVRSRAAVAEGTRRMLAAFPDRRLIGEEVIWCRLAGSPGFFSSHRIRSRMTHVGAGELGPPTGRVARYRTIADCYVDRNRIHLEWLARDNLAIALQLGRDPFRLAARLAAREPAALVRWRARAARTLLESGLHPGAAPAHPDVARRERQRVGAWLAALDAHDWAGLESLYCARFAAMLPAGRPARRAAAVTGYWSSLVESLPDLRIVPDRLTAIAGPRGERRIAVRWWAAGTHRGTGRFGPASGVPVLMLGMTHLLSVGGAIRREWTVTDELAILRQIAALRRR